MIDLHMHSTASDGTIELVEGAKHRGGRVMSINDHDSIDSYQVARGHG